MKRWRIFTKRQAQEDINKTWRLVVEDNPIAAEAFLDAIEEASSLLSATPEIGSPRYLSHPELQGLRFLPLRKFENYLLFYRALKDEEVIEIVRIVHGASGETQTYATPGRNHNLLIVLNIHRTHPSRSNH